MKQMFKDLIFGGFLIASAFLFFLAWLYCDANYALYGLFFLGTSVGFTLQEEYYRKREERERKRNKDLYQ